MTTKKRLIIGGIIGVLICGAGYGISVFAEDPRELNRVIADYYRKAMDSFYHKDYRAAVSVWRQILKMDPLQAQAERLIEMAMQKMSESVKPKMGEAHKYIEDGEYQKAQAAILELLNFDAANVEWRALNAKLEKVIAVMPQAAGNDRGVRMVRKCIQAYTARKNNPRVAVNAARYAWQMDPQNASREQLKELMESEFSIYAQGEQLLAGMTLVDQKLQSALSDIYDAKYDCAIMECNDVLDLEPGNVTAMKRAGSAYYALGSKQKAIEIWKKASVIAPDDSELQKFVNMK